MAMQTGGLPGVYRAVEYLQSTGTQYIDSGIECTSDLSVNFKALYTTNDNAAICGGIGLKDDPIYFRHHCSPFGTNFKYWLQQDSSSTSSITVLDVGSINTIYEVSIDAITGRWSVNGISRSITPLGNGMTTGKSYGIFARIASTGDLQSKPSRFYYFDFFRNGKCVGHFIPCVRKSDNKPGMYDTVSKAFFTNAGTGEFIVPA